MIDLTRRVFLIGAGAVLAAPTIVRAQSLMPIRPIIGGTEADYFDLFCAGQRWHTGLAGEIVETQPLGFQPLLFNAFNRLIAESDAVRSGALASAPLYGRYKHLRPHLDVALFPRAPDFWEN